MERAHGGLCLEGGSRRGAADHPLRPTCPVTPLQLAMGKMMEQGPVLIITFQAQLVMVIKNPKGEVVEGDPVSKAGREGRRQEQPDGSLWPPCTDSRSESGFCDSLGMAGWHLEKSQGPSWTWWRLEGG